MAKPAILRAETSIKRSGPWTRIHALAGTVPSVALLAVLLLATPIGATGPAVSASTGVWAWGAYDNASATNIYVGDYAASLGLIGGNLSSSTSYVAEYASAHAVYEAYTVLNVTAPTSTTRTAVVTAIAIANVTDLVVVNGTLPAPGKYTPGSTLALANETAVYYSHSLSIWAYRLWANYSLTTSALSLVNEQARLFAGVNATAIAWHWPTYTVGSGGSTTVSYPTSGWAELAYFAEIANMTFSPSVPLAKLPLSVGKTWNAATNATVLGATAYEVAGAVSNNGTNSTSWTAGGTTLNTTASLSLDFAVTGSTTVRYPNGTEETGYAVSSTVNGAAGGYAVWDGLAVLPAGVVPVAPARPLGPLAPTTIASGPSTVAIVSGSGLPVGASLVVGSTTTLQAAPLPTSSASSVILAVPTPVRPTASPTLPNTSTPPASGPGTPTNNNRAPAPGSATGNPGPVIPLWQLGALVGALVGSFVVVDRIRTPRRKV